MFFWCGSHTRFGRDDEDADNRTSFVLELGLGMLRAFLKCEVLRVTDAESDSLSSCLLDVCFCTFSTSSPTTELGDEN